MKKKYVLAEFIIVFLFLVFPSLLIGPKEGPVSVDPRYSWLFFVQTAIAAALDFECVKFLSAAPPKKHKFSSIIAFSSYFLLSLGSLFLLNALVNTLSLVLPDTPFFHATSSNSASTVRKYILSLPVLLFTAFYEEVIFREFLPDALIFMLPQNKWTNILAEALCILLFAFAHRYLGLLGVVNALGAAVILRICKLKTKYVYTGTLSHFIYNAILFLFTSLLLAN